MPDTPTPYWFHAKRYGMGWGLPARREGWIVLAAWLGMVVAITAFLASRNLPLYYALMAVLVVGVVAIYYAKGEPLRWRWGDVNGR